jgi:hypothetical protein
MAKPINSGKLNSLAADLAAIDAMERCAYVVSHNRRGGVEILERDRHDFGLKNNQPMAEAINAAVKQALAPFRAEIESRIAELVIDKAMSALVVGVMAYPEV